MVFVGLAASHMKTETRLGSWNRYQRDSHEDSDCTRRGLRLHSAVS